MSAVTLKIEHKSWPLAQAFKISRGSKTSAEVVQVHLSVNGFSGHGECVPYARYGESVNSVCAAIESIRPQIEAGATRIELQKLLPSGAARNALDSAYWDLQAKTQNQRVWDLAHIKAPSPVLTAYTISLDEPAVMAQAAKVVFFEKQQPLLKLKLGGQDDSLKLQAIRQAVPDARLIIDANEGWTPNNIMENIKACEGVGVELIEQPLPASDDDYLRHIQSPVCLCADESMHDASSLPHILGKYQAINLKLDKTGGLTQALEVLKLCQQHHLKIMVGCMVGSSLAMAPAMCLAPFAQYVDLDAPLLLSQDMDTPLQFSNGFVYPPLTSLWG